MCGLYGICLKDNQLTDSKRATLIGNLARANDARGGDSWGFSAITQENKIRIRRGLGEIQPYVWNIVDHQVVMGHSRFKTHGDKTIKNAHPFEIGKIIGAHNGVIRNHLELNKTYQRNFEVDSMHLFAHLNEGRVFSDIEGYGAIEWMDKEKLGYIYLCKMSGGSLSIYGIGDSDKTKGIVWSSDNAHLDKALHSAGVRKYFPYRVKGGQVYIVSDGEIFVAPKMLELYEQEYKQYDSSVVHSHTSSHSRIKDDYTKYHTWNHSWHGEGTTDDQEIECWNKYCKHRKEKESMSTTSLTKILTAKSTIDTPNAEELEDWENSYSG